MLFWKMQIKEALHNLLSAKLRSFLAILGVLVGTGSVVAMVSSGQLATEQALAQFKQLGTDLLSVSFFQNVQDGSVSAPATQEISIQDVENLPRFVPEVSAIAAYTTSYAPTAYDGNKFESAVIGVDSELQPVIKIDMQAGRFISFLDDRNPYCVIGHNIAKQLKQFGLINPVGKQIQIGNYYFTVIGVAKDWQENSFFNQDINQAILVPLGTAKLISKYSQINNIVMKIVPNANIDVTQQKIQDYINKIIPNEQIFFRSAKQLVKSMAHQQQILTLMLGLIGSISLFVGGIGVMNIMLVSVVERRKEIGIRKAVGAKRSDIQKMFLLESIALSLFGGIWGVILGILASYVISLFTGWNFKVFVLPPIVGFTVSVIVGVFFGYYPAYQAARLDPIETLRSD